MEKVWFITGSSRGLGRSLAAAALANGDKVAATARNPEVLEELRIKYPGQLYAVKLDVTDHSMIKQAVADTVAHFGRIDVLVNNAGFGITGALEAYTNEQITSQINTNLYGPIYLTQAVLPHMRTQGAGHILQISSLGGRVTSAAFSIYHAAKFGLEGFSESIAKEVAHLGIKVTIIEPGGFQTDFSNSSMTFAKRIAAYDESAGARERYFKSSDAKYDGDPEKAAKVMTDVVDHPEPPMRLMLGMNAIARLQQVEGERQAEQGKWLPVSMSTER